MVIKVSRKLCLEDQMKNLAIKGGKPVIDKQLPKYNSIGNEEKQAAIEVIESGVLSDYLGSWSKNLWWA